MLFVGVGVNSGFNKRDLFTYNVPDHILVQIGDVVVVPLGNVLFWVLFFP